MILNTPQQVLEVIFNQKYPDEYLIYTGKPAELFSYFESNFCDWVLDDFYFDTQTLYRVVSDKDDLEFIIVNNKE